MAYQVKVLYDFDAVGEGELSVKAGDIVTVTSADVGQGWLLGIGVDGREGIVPESYVEQIPVAMYAPLGRQVSKNDVFDDDFESDNEDEVEEPRGTPPAVKNLRAESESPTVSRPNSHESGGFSVGKFTHPFGKTDKVSDYLMGAIDEAATLGKDAIYIHEPYAGNFQWQVSEEPITCKIGAPRKSSKFGGMKTFIAYPVTSSISNIQVSRRYKHFDWLHERLVLAKC